MSKSFFYLIFDQIMTMSKEYGMPEKPRAILREFLQVKALSYLYSSEKAKKLNFMGGTSLRLLRNIPRFSEDLDFDNLGLSDSEVTSIVEQITSRFNSENIQAELRKTVHEYKHYYEIKFPSLLFDLGISTNPREKLMIKIDYSRSWQNQTTENILLKRYGVITSVPTNTINNLLVQKMKAYVERTTLQPRDMYDIVWLCGQGAQLDQKFMQDNSCEDLLSLAKSRFEKDGVNKSMKQKLAPFLFASEDQTKLDIFGQVLESITYQK